MYYGIYYYLYGLNQVNEFWNGPARQLVSHMVSEYYYRSCVVFYRLRHPMTPSRVKLSVQDRHWQKLCLREMVLLK